MRSARVTIAIAAGLPTAALLESAEELVVDATEVFGNNHGFTLQAALNAGMVAALIGRFEEGEQGLEARIGDAVAKWGPVNLLVLEARIVFVDSLRAMSDQRMRGLARELERDIAGELGASNPLTLLARALSASSDWLFGTPDEEVEAVGRMDAIVSEATKTYGKTVASTLRLPMIRPSLGPADYRADFGPLLLAEVELTFGIDSSLASTVKFLLHNGDSSETEQLLAPLGQLLLADSRATTEADLRTAIRAASMRAPMSDPVFNLRERLGDVLGQANNYSAALSQHSSVLFDRWRILGLDHTSTQQSIADTARQLMNTDQPGPAQRLYHLVDILKSRTHTNSDEWAMRMAEQAAWAAFESGDSLLAERRAREVVARRSTLARCNSYQDVRESVHVASHVIGA